MPEQTPHARAAARSYNQSGLEGQPQMPALLAHIKPLRALLAVAAHGSAAAAGKAIHLSQPAVTRAIGMLERACGQSLFVRTPRGMTPTSQGEQLGLRATALFAHLQMGAQEALGMQPQRQDRVWAARRFAHSVTPSQLLALLEVAATGSELQAAARLGITQPAIHAALQGLERQLAMRLFYKLPSGTRLMPPAEALLMGAKRAVAELRGMDSDIAAWQGGMRGQVVVGVLPLSAPVFLPRATQMLIAQHPQLQVRVVDGTYESLMQGLLCADIDVIAGALRSTVEPGEVEQKVLFEDELVIIAHRQHPCMQQRPIQIESLLQWPWVAPLPATPAEEALRQFFALHGLPAPSARLCAGSPLMTQAFVLQSNCLAIASRAQALLEQAQYGGRIAIVPVDLPRTQRRIGICTRAGTVQAPAVRAFIHACEKAVAHAAHLQPRLFDAAGKV